MMSLTSSHQILKKHTIVDMFNSKWTFHASPLMRDYSDQSILAKQINDNIYLAVR